MEDLAFISGRKRKAFEDDDDDSVLTPKKARLSHATPSKATTFAQNFLPSPSTRSMLPLPSVPTPPELPEESLRLIAIHEALEKVMWVALGKVQGSPDSDTGRALSIMNHHSFQERSRPLGVEVGVDDLQKLCWVWEWDGQTIPKNVTASRSEKDHLNSEEGEDVFSSSFTPLNKVPNDWVRSGSGFCINPTTHIMRIDNKGTTKRVSAYGIGIEVDWSQVDVVRRHVGGIKAVRRWREGASERKDTFRGKLEKWKKLTSDLGASKCVPIPLAGLPLLANPSILYNPAVLLPPQKSNFSKTRPTAPNALVATPSSPTQAFSKDSEGLVVPFPVIPHGPRNPSSSDGGLTPSNFRSRRLPTSSFGEAVAKLAAAHKPISDDPTTPTTGLRDGDPIVPTTPTKSIANAVEAPTSARRAALYERVRAKSESEEDSSKKIAITASVRSTEKQSQKKVVTRSVGPEAVRRRGMLGHKTLDVIKLACKSGFIPSLRR